MKGLKIVASCIVLVFVLCSGQIQIAKTSSSNVPIKGGFYTFEDGSVSVMYNLWAERGMFGMIVFNNTDSPIYLDWEKTYFFFNGSSYDFREDNGIGGWGKDTSCRANAFDFTWGKVLFPNTSFIFEMPESRYSTIPPQSAIAAAKYRLVNIDIGMAGAQSRKYECEDEANKYGLSIKFTPENSPFFFQNFVAYNINDTLSPPKILTNDFWVSELMLVRPLSVNTNSASLKGGAAGCLYNEGTSFYIRTNTAKY
jgi:hypothetical protein